jgi:hypothetical protein
MTYDLRGIYDGTVRVGDTNDAYEYAYRIGSRIYGTQNHGRETLLGMTLQVNGQAVTLAKGASLTGDVVTVIENTKLGDSVIPDLANIKREYSFTDDGLDLWLITRWLNDVTLTAAYQGMLSIVDGVANKGFTDVEFNLTSNNGAVKGIAKVFKTLIYGLGRVASLEVEHQSHYPGDLPDYRMFVQDNLQDNKIYFLWRKNSNNSIPVVYGLEWDVVNKYRVSDE